jgi:inosose dehydratase
MVKQFRIGHTGITWANDAVEQAIADVASLGYQGFETFGATLEAWSQKPCGLGPVLAKYHMPLVSAYCWASLIDPAQKEKDLDQVMRWAGMLKALGGSVVVLGASGRAKPHYTPMEYMGMVKTVNELGKRLLDQGLLCCFHPHTGTPVETNAEINMVMGEVDPRVVFFAPDVGQIQKGGTDAVAVVERYKSMIRHVHLKDFVGGTVQFDAQGKEVDPTGYVSYVPVGYGVVDTPAILALLEREGFDGWLMIELDGTATSPRPAYEAAAMSKGYLQDKLGQRFGK